MNSQWKYLLDPKHWSKKYQIIGIVVAVFILSCLTISPIKSLIGFAIMGAIAYAIYFIAKILKKTYLNIKNINQQTVTHTEQTTLTTHEEKTWEQIKNNWTDEK